MEKDGRLLRPWPERMMAAAPLLAPALAMLCACAAAAASPWFWVPCVCLAGLPCLFRTPGMGLLALALSIWAGAFLLSYDRERWGYLRGIAAGVRLDQFSSLGEGGWSSRIQAVSLRLHEGAGELLREGAPPGDEARQVMVSTVLGDKTDASPETMAKFLMSGCMHVFAVSGMHVGVAALLVLGMLRLLRVRPAAARLACLLLLALYVFVTGMSVSALRAFIMAAVWLAAPVLRRKAHPANILALAFIILCLMDPLQVFQPGFQLSFCVFAVIVCLAWWLRREKPV